MTTTPQTELGRVESRLPDDVSLYLGKKTLAKLILDAIDDVKIQLSDYDAFAAANTTLRPAMMLTLVTYCYATAVYGSGDIQLGIRHDQMIRYLCAKTYPDIHAIRSFRRYNRERIKRCLSAVLQRVWELRFCGEDVRPMDGVSCLRLSLSRWNDVKCAPDFDREAEQRIMRAVRADSMAMDV